MPAVLAERRGSRAYACYTSSNTTLTFYYDNQRSTRPGTTYDLNTGSNQPGWHEYYSNVTNVVFNSSFAYARPTSTYGWFSGMKNVATITGINYLNTSQVTNMHYMFYSCKGLTSLDVSHFNTANVTDMCSMFNDCILLENLDVSHFNTDNVTDMSYMFWRCKGLTSLDLTSFNVNKVKKMVSMFQRCFNLTTIYVTDWNMEANPTSGSMFTDCTSLVGGHGTTYDADYVNKAYAHVDGGPSNPGYFTGVTENYACYTSDNSTLTFYRDDQRSIRTGTTYDLNIDADYPGWVTQSFTRVVFDPSFADARPSSTYYWFGGRRELETITGMEYLNTSDVIDMRMMFMNCRALRSLDVSHFNTSNVADMQCMFGGCSSLKSLDLSKFNIAMVDIMDGMFIECDSLVTIYVGNDWSTAFVTSSVAMFWDCPNLVGGQGTTYDANHVDKTYAHIDGGPSNPGYFTAAYMRGDVNGDGSVSISDVTALIDYLLSGDGSGINLQAVDCNEDGGVSISDVTVLIDYLLMGSW